MFSKFSEEVQKILINSKLEMMDLKHQYIGTEHLLLALLKDNNNISYLFKNYGINYNNFRKEIIKIIGIGEKESTWNLYTPLLKKIIENSVIISKEDNSSTVKLNHLILSLIEEGEGVAIRILSNLDLDIDSIYEDLITINTIKDKNKLNIESYGVNLNRQAEKNLLEPVIAREDEINKVIEILSRKTKNNPLLIGEAGVGKTAIVEGLAKRIVDGNVPYILKDKKILSIEMASLIAGTKYRGEFEERIEKLIKELEKNQDVIIFIDEIHTIIGAGGAEGAVDASNILKPALSRGKIKLIGATTKDEYKRTIEKDKAFDRRFQKINIEEPNLEKTYKILLGIKSKYESFHGVSISNDILKKIVNLTDKYIYNRYQPDKSIDILDEVCVKCSFNNNYEKLDKLNRKLKEILLEKKIYIKNKDYNNALILKEKEKKIKNKIANINKNKVHNIVTINDIKKVIFDKNTILINDLNFNSLNFKKVENDLNKVVIGQEDAVRNLIQNTKRIKLGFKTDNKPMSFLFLGPTGVGKTLLVKEYTKMLYGNNKLIRIDMSEYKEPNSISKLIGSPSGYIGYDDNKNRFEEIRNNPCSILLLDEIEKASYEVINLFLQILDEGKITDNLGRTIRFDNVIIIMTSNIGSNYDNVGFIKSDVSIVNRLKQFFNIEFLNRIDNIIMFKKMDKQNIEKIIKNKLRDVRKKTITKNIKLSISNNVIDELIEKSNYIEFGARQVDKVINKYLETEIIDEIFNGKKEIFIKTLKV